MYKNFLNVFVFTILVFCSCSNNPSKAKQVENERIVLAYVTSWSRIMPDPNYVTHINYAFGHVTESFDGVRIDNEDRLRSIVELKKQKPSLQIMLSIGGWGSGRFSEMAADERTRLSFARDCKRVVDEFGLDGIDMDWEYPTSSAANISASSDDTDNFTELMRQIRIAIGKDKLLTFASAANARYVDFKAIDPYVDFINIMTYDMGNPPLHHAAFQPSEHTRLSAVESVDLHVEAGVAIEKLTLGMPFYGRGRGSIRNFIDYKDIINLEGYTEMWDEQAQVPYLVDAEGTFVCTFETPKSIAIKCKYLLERGMLGAMYWDYNGDDEDGTLRKAVFYGVMGND
jgi:chitinase